MLDQLKPKIQKPSTDAMRDDLEGILSDHQFPCLPAQHYCDKTRNVAYVGAHRALLSLFVLVLISCAEVNFATKLQADTEQADTEQADTEQADTEQADTEQADTEVAIDFNASLESANRQNRYLLIKRGVGSNNVVQSVIDVPSRNAIYSLHVNGAPSEVSVINKFILGGPPLQKSVRWTKKPSRIVGHQGLSTEPGPKPKKFWSSVNASIPNAEAKVVRFEIRDDPKDKKNLLVENTQIYTVWPGQHGAGSTTPAISPDGTLLIVELYVSKNENRIRVFNLEDLIDGGPGDYSTGYHLYEFLVDESVVGKDHPLQGMATDGKFIYIVTGNGDPSIGKRLAKYSLDGLLLGYTDAFSVGRNEALCDGDGKLYEPEGFYITKQSGVNILALSVASGTKGARTNRVYYLNGNPASDRATQKTAPSQIGLINYRHNFWRGLRWLLARDDCKRY